jgi:acetylornithine deacetylase/succinyl-diaminopimelate desuccinylase-like protein
VIAMRRFRAVATERTGAVDQRACAEWFVEELRAIGFSASVRDTLGQPIAVGHDRSAPGPSILFCGHYEIPPSGLSREYQANEAATSAAGRAIHQFSTDQSIQLMAFVEACRAWKAVAGQLPTGVTVLVESEGLSGSAALRSFLHMYADELVADIGLAPAARIWCCAVPAINSTLRGVCCEEFTIVADSDQLAEPHRNAAADPTLILARILSDLHDPSGRVTIPGFYAGIAIGPETEREGEAMWVGPTCEIDSVSGGRTFAGRLVTSPRAFARLYFHLVCDQDPDVIKRAFREFASARVPPGTRIEFASGSSVRPLRFSASSPAFRKVREALTVEWERQPVSAWGDASPATHALHEALGLEVLVTSFPKRQEGCHSPREASGLADYRLCVRSWVRILDALAQ